MGHDCATVIKVAKKNNVYKKSTGGKSIEVVCVETGSIFSKVKFASEWLVKHLNKDCDPYFYSTHISAVCRGKRKSVFGFSFKYLKAGIA